MEKSEEVKTFWDFYNKCISDDGMKRAQCIICKNVYNYSSTVHNLKAHLYNVHKDIIGDIDVSFSGKRMKAVGKTLRVNSMRRSKLWEHYSLVEDENRIAVCNYCSKRVSFKSTTTNLKAHLARIHPAVSEKAFSKEQDLDETSEDEASVPYDDESEDESKLSEVRPFFEREQGGRARCLICRESVPNHHADLRRHLDQHPKLNDQQDSDAQVQNDEDEDQETYTEVVYLEDANLKETKKTEKKKWRNETPAKKWRVDENKSKSLPKRRKSKYRQASSSSDEPIIKKKKEDDEIGKFGEYIICLLKKLPRDVCMKMQMNMVNMIMNANLATSAEAVPIVQPVPASAPVIQPVPASVPIMQSTPGTVPLTLQPIPQGYYVIGKNTSEKSVLQNNSETVPVTGHLDGNHSYSITIAPSPAAVTTVANKDNDSDKQNEFTSEDGA